ncbi:hypothetical protein [Nostoc sp.]|uniref:hypothetical protein n=1 Tax=Nostoc sp. TaxID=1180 RepID=UPI002FF55E76
MRWVPLRSTQPTGDSDRTDNLSSAIPSHNSPVEVNFSQAGIIEVGTSQVTVFKGGLPQIRSLPVSIAKVAASKDAFDTIVNPSKVGTTEIGFLPMTSAPDSISKISFSQNSTTKVNTKGGILQINTTEVNTSEQTFPRVINSNISKISLPDSISTQQFLNSNSLSFDLHFSTPLLDNIYSTVYTKWSYCRLGGGAS